MERPAFPVQREQLLADFIDPAYKNISFPAKEHRQLFQELAEKINAFNRAFLTERGTSGIPANQHYASIMHTQTCTLLDQVKDANAKYLIACTHTK